MSNGKWDVAGCYTLDGAVVGNVAQAAGGDWVAYGCISDWNDHYIGIYRNEGLAREAVERWVESVDL